jgi:hypothetical protein
VDVSSGGVCRWAGVMDRFESGVCAFGDRYLGIAFRFCAANSAASERDIAEGDFRALKENLVFGTKAARVSCSLSCKAFMACECQKVNGRSMGFLYCSVGPLIVGGEVCGGILDFRRESRDACETVVGGV